MLNRREALQASLAALPFTGRVEPPSGDVVCVVIESDQPISAESQAKMREAVMDTIGSDIKVLVLCPGMKMKVVRLSEAGAARLEF